MKNTIIPNNVNLIVNTYRSHFFLNCYWEPSMLSDSFDHAMQDESARQDSVEMEKFRNLQLSKFINHNDAKMVDACVWNVTRLTEARTKMEVGKLRTRGAQWLSGVIGGECKEDQYWFRN